MELHFKIADQHLPILKAIQSPKYEVILVIGERSTGKTTDSVGAVAVGIMSNIQKFIKTGKTFSTAVMRQNAGSIKGSVWRTLLNRFNELKDIPEFIWYTEIFETTIKGKEVGQIWAFCKGFKTGAKSDTANSKGMEKVNLYIIDEAEEISQADFEQLTMTAIREKSKIIIICNTPYDKHWIVKKFLNLIPSKYEGFFNFESKPLLNFTLVRSRMTDNPFLDAETKEIYQSCGDKNSPNYNLEKYCRDVLGLVSSNVKGKVFSNYSVCTNKEFDEIERPSNWGLDFGFSNDPLVLVESKIDFDTLYVKQWIYQTQLTPSQMVRKFDELKIPKNQLIRADCAAPALITELKNAGYNVIGCKKPANSIKIGIKFLEDYKIKITQSSKETLDDFNNYRYSLDSDKNLTDVPIDNSNDSIDGIRYGNEEVIFKKLKTEKMKITIMEYENIENESFYSGTEIESFY